MRRYLHVTEFLGYIVTLIGRVVVAVAVALGCLFIIAVVLSLFGPMKGTPKGTTCMSNLKQLGTAMTMYVQDYDEIYLAYDEQHLDWGVGPWTKNGQDTASFRSTSRWVPLLQPYVRNHEVFACRGDVERKRNMEAVIASSSETPFPVSYGPNRMFVNPTAYGWRKPAVSSASVPHPEQKYLLADCVTAHGFDLDTVAYVRYPDYHPSRRQNGWGPEQFRSHGKTAGTDQVAEAVTRHDLATTMVFADGHVKRLRYDEIPDSREGRGKERLTGAVVPWRSVHQ